MKHKNKIARLIFFILMATTLATNLLPARDSPYTRKGTGPKYWIAYESCWITNQPISETRWQANIDWINESYKSFGYDMICTDGWIEAAQTINTNGYITTYNDDWTHGFDYWADYLKQRDLTLGIYYNPMWLTKAAYDKNVTIQGTHYKARDLVGPISFNDPLYWVDTDKPGAKEWIQGYVNHFIRLGAVYLRIDFLENYERNYGTAKYRQALEWIQEAAGNKIFLSLVMPNCYNHGETELRYGDMIRVDDDCFNGGWDFTSNRRRGQWRPIWPQYGNAYDGFLGFSDIGGRGQMILDGDFMRLNTSATDAERMFLFSLMVMGGSPLAIADQYDTVGTHGWVYQNTELLQLHTLGFVGKPLSANPADIENSSRWVGQLPNGDWVVGLFNREDDPQFRKIDFAKELGLPGGTTPNVRDLWEHTDLGPATGGYATQLPPHACKIVTIRSTSPKYEAEVTSMRDGASKSTTAFNYSGPGYVEFGPNQSPNLLLAVQMPRSGSYTLRAIYGNTSVHTAQADVIVNDALGKQTLVMPGGQQPNTWHTVQCTVALQEGLNYITLQRNPGNNTPFNLDYLTIE